VQTIALINKLAKAKHERITSEIAQIEALLRKAEAIR
jgi:hypothetical protein